MVLTSRVLKICNLKPSVVNPESLFGTGPEIASKHTFFIMFRSLSNPIVWRSTFFEFMGYETQGFEPHDLETQGFKNHGFETHGCIPRMPFWHWAENPFKTYIFYYVSIISQSNCVEKHFLRISGL